MKRRKARMIKEPKARGEWGESVFMVRAVEHELPVSRPWGDSNSFDFVVGKPGRFVSASSRNYWRKVLARHATSRRTSATSKRRSRPALAAPASCIA